MKTIILILALALTATLAAAQKINAKDLPAPVTAAFAKLYPTVKEANWVNDDGNFEAHFDLNKAEMSATFSATGTFLEEEVEISVNALPQAALDYMKKTYPDRKVKEASKIKDAKGIITYEVETKGLDVIFDAKGAFLKEI